MFTVTGRTSDGKTVVSGVYRFFETHGLPLDVVFDLLRGRDSVPDWTAFYREAQAAGMKHDRIIAKLSESISDSYGGEFRDEVLKRLEASLAR